jgi:16S rRNA (cytosine967-C5)-methyltransferase
MSAGALADWPDWLAPEIRRAFGAGAAREMSAMAARAAVDLRINTLRIEPDKAMKALAHVGAEPHPLLRAAARIPAPPARERAPDVTVIPAFHKGWVEVQDGASQIAAAAAGNIKGAQVLDYCAGGGGKTLALAALMENTGQIFAYDSDARRLKPLYERARRAGVRNIQIVDPREDAARLAELKGRMDVVFLDAPCSGSGVWRRHPDAKWRLTEAQLHRRMAEQDAALAAGADFVRPGGRLVYATCSIFPAENEDRIAAFLAARPEFAETCACDAVASSGGLTAAGRDLLAACRRVSGALQITPYRTRTDGFYVATLVRR